MVNTPFGGNLGLEGENIRRERCEVALLTSSV